MNSEETRVSATETSLPQGFQVRLDKRNFKTQNKNHLIGGVPLRSLTLSEQALRYIDTDGTIEVRNSHSAELARRLLDAGVAQPRPMSMPSLASVTIVIPVKDNQIGVRRLLEMFTDFSVIVVDDGSEIPIVAPGVRLIRHEKNEGPAAARNTGIAAATTEYVAFLDSDTLPSADWLIKLLGHFSDPTVALVAPRITSIIETSLSAGSFRKKMSNALMEYESMCSSLDRGEGEGAVFPGGRIPYVPSAAIILRREIFEKFDEELSVAEDVDLCWRLVQRGYRIRYEPIATVAHQPRPNFFSIFSRKRFYGTGAAKLATRHGRHAAPVVLSPSMTVAMGGLALRNRWGMIIAAFAVVVSSRKMYRSFAGLPNAIQLTGIFATKSLGYAIKQSSSAVLRSYWPVSVLLALVFPRMRRDLMIIAVSEALYEWLRLVWQQQVSVKIPWWQFVVLKRCDDFFYGLGVWQGVMAERSATALLPRIGK